MAAKLLANVDEPLRANFNIPSERLAELSSASAVAAIDASLRSAIKREQSFTNPVLGTQGLLHLNWAIAFGLFGNLWGRLRWRTKATINGLWGKEAKRVMKRSNVGKYVFALLAMDLAAQGLLAFPTESKISLGPHMDPIEVSKNRGRRASIFCRTIYLSFFLRTSDSS
jgi:hypothetical protein